MVKRCFTLAQQIGKNLDDELQRQNIPQNVFAKRVGKTTRTVRRWMYEGVALTKDIELIATGLGVSVTRLVSNDEPENTGKFIGRAVSVFTVNYLLA